MELFHYNYLFPQGEEDIQSDNTLDSVTVQELETKLITLKKKIDVYYDANRKYNKWNVMSRDLHQYEGVVVKSPFRSVSRAFYKLMEILVSFKSKLSQGKTSFETLHLCEAPGGFIQACLLIYGDKIRKFYTSSIDSPIKYHKEIKNNTKGHILSADILDHKTSDVIFNNCPPNGYFLITADGAFDVSNNYEDQEKATYDLLFNEIAIALSSQTQGGSFILKLFDCFHPRTWNLIVWLKKCYKEVHICKPPSSRPVNSEKYCVCINFIKKCSYNPSYNKRIEYPNFRYFFLKKTLEFQIKNLEIVFDHILLSEEQGPENDKAREYRYIIAKIGETRYSECYGKYFTHSLPFFSPATTYQ